MEADSGTKPLFIENHDRESKEQICSDKSILGKLFPTVWIRRPFCVNNEVDRILLDNGYSFLFYFGCFFWALFLLFG